MVRNTIGYGRIAGDDALQAVYAVLTPRYNVFYPNLTCVDKLQIGQKKRRVYEPEPKTPFPRILALPDSEVPESCKRRLVEQKQSLNIIALQRQLDKALAQLDRLVHRVPGTVAYPESHA